MKGSPYTAEPNESSNAANVHRTVKSTGAVDPSTPVFFRSGVAEVLAVHALGLPVTHCPISIEDTL